MYLQYSVKAKKLNKSKSKAPVPVLLSLKRIKTLSIVPPSQRQNDQPILDYIFQTVHSHSRGHIFHLITVKAKATKISKMLVLYSCFC